MPFAMNNLQMRQVSSMTDVSLLVMIRSAEWVISLIKSGSFMTKLPRLCPRY